MKRSFLPLSQLLLLLLLQDYNAVATSDSLLHSSSTSSWHWKAITPQPTDSTTISFHSPRSLLLISHILEDLRGGGRDDYDDDEEEYDEYDSDEDNLEEESRSTHSARDRYHSRPRPRYDPNMQKGQKTSSSSSLSSATNAASAASKFAAKSLSKTGSLAFNAFVKTPGKLAFHVIRPKHVDLVETFGLWRLDQEVIERSNRRGDDQRTITSVATIEFIRPKPPPRGDRGRPLRGQGPPPPPLVVIRHSKGESKDGQDGGEKESVYRAPYTFVRKNKYLKGASLSSFQTSFVAPAFLVGENQTRMYGYKGTWQRKLADKSVIKLKGKIYQVHKQKFGKKRGEYVYGPAVGRFVMRRRISISDDDEELDGSDVDDSDDEFEEEEDGEYEDTEEYSDFENDE